MAMHGYLILTFQRLGNIYEIVQMSNGKYLRNKIRLNKNVHVLTLMKNPSSSISITRVYQFECFYLAKRTNDRPNKRSSSSLLSIPNFSTQIVNKRSIPLLANS